MNTVLITGATSGIGLQLAQDYASQGFYVYACGRNSAKLSDLSEQFENIQPLVFDLTDRDATISALSNIDIVPELWILNAGDCEYIDEGNMDSQLVKRVFDINVIGLSNAIEACQRHFVRGHRLAIVGSIASEVALPRAEAYGASKAAVSYLARALQLDLKPKGIEVSIIYPGFVETPLTDKNTFDMPMKVSPQRASQEIRRGLEQGKSHIYFPKKFTSILRFIGVLPYRWQNAITSKVLAQG
ncbi:short-chain dehydrogenase [Vibrio tubiashii]|nr:short-chain dehydrogenase [Vibrio tubiashii]